MFLNVCVEHSIYFTQGHTAAVFLAATLTIRTATAGFLLSAFIRIRSLDLITSFVDCVSFCDCDSDCVT